MIHNHYWLVYSIKLGCLPSITEMFQQIKQFCASQQFFSNVRTFSCLPGLNQYFKAKNKVSCSRTQHSRTQQGLEVETLCIFCCLRFWFARKEVLLLKGCPFLNFMLVKGCLQFWCESSLLENKTNFLLRKEVSPILLEELFISHCLHCNHHHFRNAGLDKEKNQYKIVNIFLPISFSICVWCSKEPCH